jgi:uncharacterized protein (DUF2141 family)
MNVRRLSVAVLGFGLVCGGASAVDDEPQGGVVKSTGPCEQAPYSIAITVKNVKSAKGLITVDLHGDDPDSWLRKGARLHRVRVPTVQGETKVCMPVEKPGTYAFALYHDKDANRKLNKNWIGLPSEPYGVSNDPPIRMGPPSYKDAAIQVTGPLTAATVHLSD